MNRERIKQVIDRIEANPKMLDQGIWHCGTKHCFAGYAQILSGKYDAGAYDVNTSETIFEEARLWLDLTIIQAMILFYYCDDLRGIKAYINMQYADEDASCGENPTP